VAVHLLLPLLPLVWVHTMVVYSTGRLLLLLMPAAWRSAQQVHHHHHHLQQQQQQKMTAQLHGCTLSL